MATNEELNEKYGKDNIQQLNEHLKKIIEERAKLMDRVKEIEYRLSQLRKKEDVKREMLLDEKTFVNYYSLYQNFDEQQIAEPKTPSEPKTITKVTTETKVTNFINEFNSNIIKEDKIAKYNKVLLFIYKFLETYEINEEQLTESTEDKRETKQQEDKPEDNNYTKFIEFIKKSKEKNNYKILKNLKQTNRLDFSYFLLNNI